MDIVARQTLCRACFGKMYTLRPLICNSRLNSHMTWSMWTRQLHSKFEYRRPQIVGRCFQNGGYGQSIRRLASESVPPKMGKKETFGPVTWKSVLFFAGVGGVFFLGFQYVKKEKELKIAQERSKSLGKAAIGGPWKLMDHDGKERSSEEFLGQWVLLYFGFTHCPDICPEELEKTVEVVDGVDALEGVPNLKPLFITVDPDRDTPKVIKEYCLEFSPKILGLTGTKEQIDNVTRSYRVYYSIGPKDEDNDYIVDHSIIQYLVNPKGDFVDFYGQNKVAEEVKNSIVMQMHRYSQLNK
ncbi:protein SCO1 homolog, mitochondrial-like [Gigantopelta aegis]|uniref:protein SCO1 homolog, mitochondrial-like n=1 Tax=Gigantopelta aegis TaxID=1735272 RepID=UPI001B889144|nr:protein SCO1 homolog, mitochondrial-like [Gigantopelta aegis]XP_041378564.1 protein SCO1 homolog, mitochondrial-like [Gigantopelta aegis]